MTACGGNFIGLEVSRNEQAPHEGELRRLRLRAMNKEDNDLWHALRGL